MASNAHPDSTDIDRLHAAVAREKADLPAGGEPAPMWAIFLGLVVAVLAGGQFGSQSGGYSLDSVAAYGPAVDPRGSGPGVGKTLSPLEKAMKGGGTTYALCAGCHLPTGTGVAGQFPPLANSEIVTGGTEQLIRIPQHGLIGPVTAAGVTVNNPAGMAAFGATMSDGDLANVLTYIRNSWGNKASMITKEMVAKVRDTEKARTKPWTIEELKPFADKNVPGDLPEDAAAAPAAKK